MTTSSYTTPAYELMRRISNFGDCATFQRLRLNTAEIRLLDQLLSRGLVVTVGRNPSVLKVDKTQFVVALGIERDLGGKPKTKKPPKPVLTVAKPKPQPKTSPHPSCKDWILEMLVVHGELCVCRQLHPLLKAQGKEQTEAQINNALRALMNEGKISKRKSYKKVHGTGVYAYSLTSKQEAA